MRKPLAAAAALALPFAFPAAALADEHEGGTYVAQLGALNDSGVSGSATLTLEGNQLTVEINSSGLLAGSPHAQHLHIPDAEGVCPPASADDNGDGIISTPEGLPFYGGIMVSLTTEGATGAGSALAVERFPTAEGGTISYERTIEVSDDIISSLDHAVIVQHGIDVNDNGKYDLEALGVSPLAEGVPAEATTPVACGMVSMAGAGGADAGAGGTAGVENAGLLAAGAASVAAAGGIVFFARRRVEQD